MSYHPSSERPLPAFPTTCSLQNTSCFSMSVSHCTFWFLFLEHHSHPCRWTIPLHSSKLIHSFVQQLFIGSVIPVLGNRECEQVIRSEHVYKVLQRHLRRGSRLTWESRGRWSLNTSAGKGPSDSYPLSLVLLPSFVRTSNFCTCYVVYNHFISFYISHESLGCQWH